MTMKFYLILAAITISLPSCYKQSIADAMLATSDKQTKITATFSYEINGESVTVIVKDADNQGTRVHTLECVKSDGYVLGCGSSSEDFVFTFYTDSLKVGNYQYTSNYGPSYVTTFQGYPQYVFGPTDNMSFNITAYKDGHISGTFSGQLTPAISQGYYNNVYGTLGSVVIKNGSFTNVPVVY
jgi:hypothetical protein